MRDPSTTFCIADYTCNPPPLLYRVLHPGSQALPSKATGNIRTANQATIQNELDLQKAVSNHWNWNSKEPSHFMSVFADRDHAYNWANKRSSNPSDLSFLQISTAALPPSTYIFRSTDLKELLGLDHDWDKNEYLILRWLPARAFNRYKDITKLRGSYKELQCP